jgi:hypothetical protein
MNQDAILFLLAIVAGAAFLAFFHIEVEYFQALYINNVLIPSFGLDHLYEVMI